MDRNKIIPFVSLSHDVFANRLKVNVELPGVREDSIALEMKEDSFCISAPTNGSEYAGCFPLDHKIDSGMAEIRFQAGALEIIIPYKDHWDRIREGFMGRPVVKG